MDSKLLFIIPIILLASEIIPSYALNINSGSLITGTSQGESNKIAVQLSQQCITVLKNHMKTGCPTYLDLYGPDNTNKNYYGKLVNDSGFIHRSKPLSPNSFSLIDILKVLP